MGASTQDLRIKSSSMGWYGCTRTYTPDAETVVLTHQYVSLGDIGVQGSGAHWGHRGLITTCTRLWSTRVLSRIVVAESDLGANPDGRSV